MVSDKTPGELMVAVFALIGESFLQSRGQLRRCHAALVPGVARSV